MTDTQASYLGVGIDPGWKNLGFAIVHQVGDGEIEVVHSETINPSSGGFTHTAQKIAYEITKAKVTYPDAQCRAMMERYVAYQNVQTAESENILMTIGALIFALEAGPVAKVDLTRAVDWKVELVKLLVKSKGFDNPSEKLDKKFSIAAAKACVSTGAKFETDHEADAICLASLPIIRSRFGKRR